MTLSRRRARQDFHPRRRRRVIESQPVLESLEERQLLTTFWVSNTDDSGAGSLRQAIRDANARLGPDTIAFSIPAQTAPGVAVTGFDPGSQTWRIALSSPLPRITDALTLDAYTQAQLPVPFHYADDQPGQPTLITSSPSTVLARNGNNARVRVVLDSRDIPDSRVRHDRHRDRCPAQHRSGVRHRGVRDRRGDRKPVRGAAGCRGGAGPGQLPGHVPR